MGLPFSRGASNMVSKRRAVISKVPAADAFYGRVVRELALSRIPFMVGGGYAFARHTGIDRPRRDFDVFVMSEDAGRVLERFAGLGYRTRRAHPHWLGKIYHGGRHADVIYSSGNGVVRVDRDWFRHASVARLYGRRVLLCPVEEMIWSKAFVMERERFDGADVLHLIRAQGRRVDWARLLRRFGPFARVLLAHVALFDFVYPGERGAIPERVRRALASLSRERAAGRICRGTLLSRTEYQTDLREGFADARLAYGVMTPADIAHWTQAAAAVVRRTGADARLVGETDGANGRGSRAAAVSAAPRLPARSRRR